MKLRLTDFEMRIIVEYLVIMLVFAIVAGMIVLVRLGPLEINLTQLVWLQGVLFVTSTITSTVADSQQNFELRVISLVGSVLFAVGLALTFPVVGISWLIGIIGG